MDKNYWKEAYKEYWEISSKKEIFVKELIESKTGFKASEPEAKIFYRGAHQTMV